MRLGYVALKLRQANTRFENRIGGAAALSLAMDSTLQDEMVFVIPLDEDAAPNVWDSSINQLVTERVGVVVALKMDEDPSDVTGIKAFDKLDEVRQEIFAALLGWQMPDAESLMSYAGGRLLDFNRAWLWYQFMFSVQIRLSEMVELDLTDVDLFKKIYAQYVLGPWGESPASDVELEGVPPYLPIKETDPDRSDLRLVDMKQMVQEEEE